MKRFLLAIAAVSVMCIISACGEDSAKACVRPVYCVTYTPTGMENGTDCWEDVSKRDVHVDKHKADGTYISQEDKCLDQ